MNEWWQVCQALRDEVVPLLSADAQAFAEGPYMGGEGLLFTLIVLDAAVDEDVPVADKLLTAVERLILLDTTGDDRAELIGSLSRLRRLREAA